MIEATNLTKKYGDHLAVDHLSFRVEKGQIIGKAAEGLSVPVHASVSGIVRKVEAGVVILTAGGKIEK